MPPQPLNNDKLASRPRVSVGNHPSGPDDRFKGPSRSLHAGSSGPNIANRQRQQHQNENLSDYGNAHDTVHRRQRQKSARSRPNDGGSSNSQQYSGMMPMGGGMGMGMGMGMPFGYGMGYGGMMGGGGLMAGPMSMVYSVNYFIAMMGQLTAMFGMSVQAIGPLYQMARESLVQLEKSVRQSEVRRWLQRKSAQSPLLRGMLVLASMLAASQAVRLIRYLLELRMRRNNPAITPGAAADPIGGALVSAAGSLLPGDGV